MFTAKQDGNNKKQDMIHDSPLPFTWREIDKHTLRLVELRLKINKLEHIMILR